MALTDDPLCIPHRPERNREPDRPARKCGTNLPSRPKAQRKYITPNTYFSRFAYVGNKGELCERTIGVTARGTLMIQRQVNGTPTAQGYTFSRPEDFDVLEQAILIAETTTEPDRQVGNCSLLQNSSRGIRIEVGAGSNSVAMRFVFLPSGRTAVTRIKGDELPKLKAAVAQAKSILKVGSP